MSIVRRFNQNSIEFNFIFNFSLVDFDDPKYTPLFMNNVPIVYDFAN